MKKPPYYPASPAKPALSWGKTWARLLQHFKDPSGLRPVPLADEDRAAAGAPRLARALPALKGNVCHTMKEILRLFLKLWADAPRAVNLSLRTTYASLAKLCRNRDAKTAYLHVLALIEHGFLRAKQRLSHGVQLLLHPDLLVFEGTPASAPLQHLPAPRAAARPARALVRLAPGTDLTAYLWQLADGMRLKFSTESP